MGCVSSVFQFGSYLVQEGAEVNEEQKEESSFEKDGAPVPSSPSQDTVVTIASSGNEKVQESPTKIGAPLAREEEYFVQQASPVAGDAKEETKKGGEAKTGDAEAPEPEVKELQKVNETKLEKEKTVDNSGITTEKTVYTQMSESVTIQETKGPAVDPFASSQKTVFPPFSKSWHDSKPQATESQNSPSYVHSVKVTESSSPVSVNSDATPEKKQSVHVISESVSEHIASVPEKVEVSVKTEPVEVATDVVESLNGSHTDQSQSEKVISPSLLQEELETPGNEAEIYEEQAADDNERSEVEGAVVKIQAGIRGYLTRKSLKESRKDGPMVHSPKGGASVQPKQDEVPSEEPLVLNVDEIETDTESFVKEIGESDAAVKIQAMYRGYRTRKQLDDLLNENEPCDGEVEALNISAEQTESAVQENKRSTPDRSPVIVTENFVPILKTQVTITPPSSPTIKKEQNISILSSMEVGPAEIPEKADVETADIPDDEEEDEGSKMQAATKIQAAFRGYKVRKVSRKEPSGNVREISEETKEDIVLGSDGNIEANCESPQLMRDTPSPPLEPDNDDDTLEDNTADDTEDIPNVQWQTSELYTDDTSPKHLQEESKTESVAEEPTAPATGSPKTTQTSSAQVILSTARVFPDESHGSAKSTTVEDQQVQSDH